MRDGGIVAFAMCFAIAACNWPVAEQPYTSAIAQPTEEDAIDPPETRALACTDEGFTLVLGPDPGCVGIDGIFGRGIVDVTRVITAGEGTPVRVIRRGSRIVDIEVVVRCRPFFNDAAEQLIVSFAPAFNCEGSAVSFPRDCRFDVGPIQTTLIDEDVLELGVIGEGVEVDFHACARPDP